MKTKKQKAFRHGEILLLSIDKLPKGLKLSSSKTLMKGSHGHDHTFNTGKFYPKQDGTTFGYLVAEGTSLLHEEHSPKVGQAKIPDGVYQLVKQQEYTPDGLIPVID